MKYTLIILLTFVATLGYSQDKNNAEKAVCTRYEDGSFKETGLLKNSRLEGQWVKYSETGEAIVVGNYKNGSKEGKWTFVDNSSGVITEATYSKNKVVKLKKFLYDSPTSILSYTR